MHKVLVDRKRSMALPAIFECLIRVTVSTVQGGNNNLAVLPWRDVIDDSPLQASRMGFEFTPPTTD